MGVCVRVGVWIFVEEGGGGGGWVGGWKRAKPLSQTNNRRIN